MPADVFVTIKIMPTGPEIDLHKLQKACEAKIMDFGAKNIQSAKQEPIAFGLKALIIMFLLAEAKSNTDVLEDGIRHLPGVNSAEITDVRRALG
jgi:elongation factor 1-beta